MAAYTQANRFFSIRTPLGPDVLLLAGLRGREAISELFRFDAELAAANDASTPFEKIIGQGVTIKIKLPGGLERFLHGMVSGFEEGDRDSNFTYYQAEIVPRFWLATQQFQSRIFQQKSVPDILADVLAPLRPDLKFALTGTYHERDYCTQYRETDFAFASRIMEEEGLYYFFEHHEDRHVMVVADSLSKCPSLPAGDKVVYHRGLGGTQDHTRVLAWRRRLGIRSTSFKVRDYHFEIPDKDLEAHAALQTEAKVGDVTQQLPLKAASLEHQDYPGGYAKRFDGVNPSGGDQSAKLQDVFEEGTKTAKLRAQEAAARAVTITGQSTCGQFTPGHKFELERHFNASGSYLLVSVEHEIEPDYHFRSDEDAVAPAYRNRFTALPDSIPYRPARVTPPPVIAGAQTAFVVAPTDAETFLDKYGRVKVQFHWDAQAERNGTSSCWIRVGQLWASKRWGAFFWPRVGMEVIVNFEQGDPDRPLIVGCVYNGENMPPYELPDNAVLNGIRSCSARANADASSESNSFIFDDEPDSEHVYTHSETTQFSASEQDWCQITGGQHVQIVGGAFTTGSGSGSGSGPDAVREVSTAGSASGGAGGKLVDEVKKGLGFAGSFNQYVFGTKNLGTLGWMRQFTIGPYTECYYDPLAGVLGAVPGFGGLAAAGGHTTLNIGSATAMNYARQLRVSRGPITEGAYDLSGTSTVFSALYGPLLILEQLLTDNDMKWNKFSTSTDPYLWGAISGVTLAIWTMVEQLYCEARSALAKGEELTSLFGTVMFNRLETIPNVLGTVQGKTEELAQYLGKVGTSYEITSDGPYTINAQQFSISTQGSVNVSAVGNTSTVTMRGASFLMTTAPPNQNGPALSIDVMDDSALSGRDVALNGSRSVGISYGSLLNGGGNFTLGFTENWVTPSIKLRNNLVTQNILMQAGACKLSIDSVAGIKLSFGPNYVLINNQGVTIKGLNLINQATLKNTINSVINEKNIQAQESNIAKISAWD